MKKLSHFIDVIMNFPPEGKIWTIALRRTHGKKLYEGNQDGFKIVPNSFRYWRADPFLFEHNGETYIFAELFDRIKGKGKIGVAKIKNGKCGKFKTCLDLPEHLSYPCVFELNGNIYMVPECSRSEKITIYKCVSFPYEWKEERVIFNGPGVDTTPYIDGDNVLFFSTLHIRNKNNDNIYSINNEGKVIPLKENNFYSRSAGHFIKTENGLLRPTQNCSVDYGANIIINKVEFISENILTEKKMLNIFCPGHKNEGSDLNVNVIGDSKFSFEGIHTYNSTSAYEAVDLAYTIDKRSIQYFLRKLYKRLKR